MSRLCRLRNAKHGDDGQWAHNEIVSLRQQLAEAQQEIADRKADCETGHDQDEASIAELRKQLAEKDAEISRLNSSPTIEACRQMIKDKAVIEASELHNQLAAGQAREQQLRNLMTMHMDNSHHGNGYIEEALDLSTDTSALSAIVTKAGEVMRERCAGLIETVWDEAGAAYEIRDLPGVTLEDL